MPTQERYAQDPSPSGLLEAAGGKNSGCGVHLLPSFQEVQGQDHLAPTWAIEQERSFTKIN